MDGVSIFNIKFESGPDSPDGIGLRHIGWAASFHLLLFYFNFKACSYKNVLRITKI